MPGLFSYLQSVGPQVSSRAPPAVVPARAGEPEAARGARSARARDPASSPPPHRRRSGAGVPRGIRARKSSARPVPTPACVGPGARTDGAARAASTRTWGCRSTGPCCTRARHMSGPSRSAPSADPRPPAGPLGSRWVSARQLVARPSSDASLRSGLWARGAPRGSGANLGANLGDSARERGIERPGALDAVAVEAHGRDAPQDVQASHERVAGRSSKDPAPRAARTQVPSVLVNASSRPSAPCSTALAKSSVAASRRSSTSASRIAKSRAEAATNTRTLTASAGSAGRCIWSGIVVVMGWSRGLRGIGRRGGCGRAP